MKMFSLAALLAAVCFATPAQHPPAGAEDVLPRHAAAGRATVFVNVQVIPMDRERFLAHQTVVVENGVITAMGAGNSVKIPDGAIRIEGRGRFLMPGLADMHVHVSQRHLLLYLANGVTTIRNMGGSPEILAMRKRVNDGELPGPRIFTTGPLTAGVPQRYSFAVVVKTPEEAEKPDGKQDSGPPDSVPDVPSGADVSAYYTRGICVY